MRERILNLPKNKAKRVKACAIFALSGCLSWGLAPGAWSVSSSQILKAAGHKRLEASISSDSMNRIAVSNDRITQIFGDEGTFESQNDEATGQVFLKPTSENGAKDLSLTLITEQGLTQDLTLKPIAKSATTLILTREWGEREPSAPGVRNQEIGARKAADSFPFDKSVPIQEQVINVLKLAIAGQLQEAESNYSSDASSQPRGKFMTEACAITFQQAWQAGIFRVQSFQVKNQTETPLELQEKDFYQPGDLALSFKKGVLPIGGMTTLYVVSRASKNSEATA